MNKINKYFLMGSVAFTGMMGFTACSSDNDAADNGNGTPTENTVVKTQFALNVPQAGKGTRMSEGMTQQGNSDNNWNFRNIDNMRLFSFAETPSEGADKILNQIVLGSSEGAFESDNNRRIYRDVTVPVGTKHFVFYGTATNPTSESENTAAKRGELVRPSWADVKDLAKVNFQLAKINASVNLGTSDEAGLIITALNKVAQTEYDKKNWSAADANGDQFEKHAAKLYKDFVTLTAGSYASVKSTLEELVKAAGKPSSDASLLGTIAKNAEDALTEIAGAANFPGKFNMPDGVAQLTYDATNRAFSYVGNDATSISTANKVNYNKITYPASLDYTINTTVKANDKVLTGLTEWPSYENWSKDAEGTWGSDWGNTVTINTKSIGLEKAIQYSVATLEFQVKANESLADNAKNIGGQIADNTIAAMSGNKSNFIVTGILIGGQPNNVGWNYEPKALGTSANEALAFDNTIYDNELNNATEVSVGADEASATKYKGYNVKKEYSEKNYTLVLDNKQEGNGGDVVYVTMELVNNSGSDFYGVNGIVPNYGKFYLVGKLDVNATNQNTVNKNNVDHIFVQDHKTIAKFTIGSLKNAYNTIPDLRSSSISLGLAVNLEWQNGMEFEYTID